MPNAYIPTPEEDKLAKAIVGLMSRRCGQHVLDAVEKKHPSPPRVFHMTDAQTSLKILQSGILWASEASTLNDASEEKYCRDLAERRARAREPNWTFFERALAEMIRTPEKYGAETPSRFFLTSFCANLRRASTWLNYGRGGTGVAIGFDLSHRPNESFFLFPIEYDEAAQLARIDGLFDIGRAQVDELTAALGSKLKPVFVSLIAAVVHAWLLSLAIAMKDESFSDECEWRIVHHHLPAEKVDLPDYPQMTRHVRIGGAGRSIQYVEAQLPISSIKEIVLGYSCGLDVDHLRDALPKEIQGIPITRSTVPVRPT